MDLKASLTKALREPETRTRLLGVTFALCALATLPVPSPQLETNRNVMDMGLWFVTAAFCWIVWFKPKATLAAWTAAMVLSFAGWRLQGEFTTLALLALWGVWFKMRRTREAKLMRVVFALGLLGLGLMSPAQAAGESTPITAPGTVPAPAPAPVAAKATAPAPAPAPVASVKDDEDFIDPPAAATTPATTTTAAPTAAAAPAPTPAPAPAPVPKGPEAKISVSYSSSPEDEDDYPVYEGPTKAKVPVVPLPRYLAGYKLSDLASCGAVDIIPWKFRPDRRKTRLVLRDVLRLNTETQFETWEVNQIMDGEGYVTYAFSKLKDGHRFESLVIKDNVFNRIVLQKGKYKVSEVHDLRTLINRPVLSFAHADGSSLTFSPGLAGQSVLTVELSQQGGRPLPPLYMHGSYCERAKGDTDSLDSAGTSKTSTPATGGSTTTSGFGGGT